TTTGSTAAATTAGPIGRWRCTGRCRTCCTRLRRRAHPRRAPCRPERLRGDRPVLGGIDAEDGLVPDRREGVDGAVAGERAAVDDPEVTEPLQHRDERRRGDRR